MSEWLQRQWYKSGVWQFVLMPLSWLFLLLSSLRRLAYRLGIFKTIRLPVPVIVVGNITVGGTGKTPLVIWLAEQLAQAGYKPGIISRGYGGKNDLPMAVTDNSDPAIAGDEPVMIAGRTIAPVWVGRDRAATGMALLNAHPACDLIISDDGLQHYRLTRDAEIVVIDGQRHFGNGRLLPAGPLREPARRLASVDAVVSNGMASDEGVIEMQLQPAGFRNLKDAMMSASASEFTGKRLLAIAGIGNPGRFFAQLKTMGLQFAEKPFPDHHAYTPEDLPTGAADAILMTEKDAVKCRAFARPDWWYLAVDAKLDRALVERVLKKLRK
ncbi:tetraacyldisaccharide 4'-kinase [Methylobacillus sp. MM3]|jgi:tetraacyldisaccharide 4'-kinase|uniref:tetraacyldisaccharide 4'-kinase n=1 Tax=Methylobacillus sp. MM3 TaxID=1848039 RepID=UPI0007DF980E|nr:tetraacyldisaccharide 4'-kinase [Methylobacillus sp. MM3]OAJ69420.1 tetraacyldisaccharide 4'-kinase [Methylobacillus sp. MM3]